MRSRTLVWLLVLHIGHCPLLWWDGDNVGSRSDEEPAVASWWDIDLLFLGVPLPDDSDDGPVDPDPERQSPSSVLRGSQEKAARPSVGPSLLSAWLSLLALSEAAELPASDTHPPKALSSSYPPGVWLRITTVLRC